MDLKRTVQVSYKCRECGCQFVEEKPFYITEIDKRLITKQKKNVRRAKCPNCDKELIENYHFIYIDEKRKYLIAYNETIELLYFNYSSKINKEYCDYKLIGSRCISNMRSIILSVESNLDWKIVQLYMRERAIAINRARSKTNKKKDNIYAFELINKNGNLKILIYTYSKETFVCDFQMEGYKKAFNHYFDWIDDINPFFLDDTAIDDLLEAKTYEILNPVCHYFYIECFGFKTLAVCDAVLADTISIGDFVDFILIGSRTRLVGEVIGHEMLDYYKVPVFLRKLSQIRGKSKRIVEFSSYSQNNMLDDDAVIKEIVTFNGIKDKKERKIAENKLFKVLRNTKLIIVDPVERDYWVRGALFNEDNKMLFTTQLIERKHRSYFPVFTSPDKVSIDGTVFVFDFDTIVRLFKHNPLIEGLVFNEADDNVLLDLYYLNDYESKNALLSDEEIIEFFNSLSEDEKQYFDGFEYECLQKHLIEHKSFGVIAKECNTSIQLARREYGFALGTLESLAKVRFDK